MPAANCRGDRLAAALRERGVWSAEVVVSVLTADRVGRAFEFAACVVRRTFEPAIVHWAKPSPFATVLCRHLPVAIVAVIVITAGWILALLLVRIR